MAQEFSAQVYLDMDADQFKAEAERLRVDLSGKSRNEQVDAVYNAELAYRSADEWNRRQKAERAKTPPPPPQGQEGEPEDTNVLDLEVLPLAQLRRYAAEHDIPLGNSVRSKADVIAAIQASDAANERDNGPEIEAGRAI